MRGRKLTADNYARTGEASDWPTVTWWRAECPLCGFGFSGTDRVQVELVGQKHVETRHGAQRAGREWPLTTPTESHRAAPSDAVHPSDPLSVSHGVNLSLRFFYVRATKGIGWLRFGANGVGFWWYSEKREGPYHPLLSEREGYTKMPRHVGRWWFKVLKPGHR